MAKIKYMTPPLIKEILEQQRLILEMQKVLIEILSKPPLIYKSCAENPIKNL